MTFTDVKTKSEMKAALATWLKDAQGPMQTSDKLPDWKDKQTESSDGEFPFHLDAGVRRQSYLPIRPARRPMFCYVQGMESLGCVVLGTDGKAAKLGAQSFPG